MEQRPSHWSESPKTFPSSPSSGPAGARAGRGRGPSGRRGVTKGVWIAIAVVVCVVAAGVAAYLALSPGKETATNTDTTSQTQIETQAASGPLAAAADAAAKSLVRNAMTAIESAYVDLLTFDEAAATAAVLQSIEPSITFVAVAGTSAATAPKASAADDAVNYSGTEATYAVGTVSTSGKTFAVTVDKRAGGGMTFYVGGSPHDW